MSDHAVTIEFNGGKSSFPNYALDCNAPLESMCHAEFDCDCEFYYDFEVVDGNPRHRPESHEGDDWHVGRFNAHECNYVNWFNGNRYSEDENLIGSVTFPVSCEWERDHFTFVIEKPTTPQDALPIGGERR